jgi:hypothetical protein
VYDEIKWKVLLRPWMGDVKMPNRDIWVSVGQLGDPSRMTTQVVIGRDNGHSVSVCCVQIREKMQKVKAQEAGSAGNKNALAADGRLLAR